MFMHKTSLIVQYLIQFVIFEPVFLMISKYYRKLVGKILAVTEKPINFA